MDWYDCLNPDNQKEFECTECGTPMDKEGSVCSGTCFEASMI
jgi:hypothetical protein